MLERGEYHETSNNPGDHRGASTAPNDCLFCLGDGASRLGRGPLSMTVRWKLSVLGLASEEFPEGYEDGC